MSCAPGLDVERFGANTFNDAGGRDSLALTCPAQRTAVGGGGSILNVLGGLFRHRPHVVGQAEIVGWDLGARNFGGVDWSLDAALLCYLPIVFRDGFESGGTGAWSGTVP